MASTLNRVRHFFLTATATAAVLFLSPVTGAQSSPPQDLPYPDGTDTREWSDDEIPAHLAIVDGDVTLEREGRVEAAVENLVLLAGDRLRTSRGRAEVLFADGSALDIDDQTSVDLLSDSLVRLLDGRMRLFIARSDNALDYRVDTAAGSAFIRAAGDYRLTLTGARGGTPELDLAVLRGSAELANDYGRTIVRAGTHALCSARLAPSLPYVTNSAAWDSFDRWVEDQRDARLGVTSSRYLPAELRYYGGAFDRYGAWGYEPGYGNVWYPAVDIGWRPYYAGRWSFIGSFGWTWIGLDRWSWPTHHYGRWGYRNRWYWIPDRRWSPAWVSWGYAPGFVSWCPLGFDGRPVISITNIHVTRVDPWIGWTVAPARSFAPNVIVSRYVTTRQSAPSTIWSQFSLQRRAPVRPTIVAQDVRPLRAPTARYAVPRDSSLPGRNTAPAARSSTSLSSQLPNRTAPSEPGRSVQPGSRFDAARIPQRSTEPTRQTPSRIVQPRVSEPSSTPSREVTATPWSRSRETTPTTEPRQIPRADRPASSAPSRVIRSREPQAEPQAPRSIEPPGARMPSAVPWSRSRSADRPTNPEPRPAPGARERLAPSEPSSSRPSGGWGSMGSPSRSRVAPAAPSARPSGGGDRPSSQPTAPQSGGRGTAVRRGGGS